MDKDDVVMLVVSGKNECIYIGKLGEVPSELMANYVIKDFGFDFAVALRTILVERRR